ncbi:MAG: glycosyltransferase family 117 protein [Candidatus Limnocylindria bacterium]
MAVSIHRVPDAPGPGPVASRSARSLVPYASPELAWAAAAVFLVALAIYLRTMMPSTGFWDTAEAQTVPHTLSIFHPTGFPTYTLLGWAWSQLPFGEVAWRMNVLSGVCVAGAAGLAVLVAGRLLEERHRWAVAAAAAVAGLTFAFASEPWRNALRADVHALHILVAALLTWLLVTWRSAERAGSPRAGRWLMAAALAFGLGLGNHPLTGLMAFGIAAWLVMVDPRIWRRWRLVLACAALLAAGLAVYAYIPLRAVTPPEPPLFYARPDTFERFRYLVFAEQFHGLFDPFSAPLANLGPKWADAERVLARQLIGPGWLVAALGASVLAVRQPGAFAFLGLLVAANVFYSMNFPDGDIDRYYMLSAFVGAVLVGVAVSAFAAAAGRAFAEAGRRSLDVVGRRRLATLAGGLVIGLGALLPGVALVTMYAERDQSANRDADLWVASVHAVLPPNAVLISWWSYSTPLWYHRWVAEERPDVKIIDERNILDDGYGTIDRAIEAYHGRRTVYVVPPHWQLDQIRRAWRTETVPTFAGYTDLLRIEGPR